MSLAKQEFTDAGRSMLGRAQNTEVLHITKIVVGAGSASQPSQLWPLTALINWKMDVVISSKRDYGQGTLLIEGSLRSDQAPSAFDLHEVGIMAHIGAEADRLYSVANAFTDPVDHIDPAAPTIQVFKVKLIIDRIPAAQLSISIGPSENVVGQNLGADTVGPGVYRDALGNVLNFKRIIKGTSMDIHQVPDDVNPTAIYIGVATLTNDLDVYVPMNYPSPPAGAPLFPTVQAAHDYLRGFIIPPDKYARIHVGPSILTTALCITFNHPNSKQISLIGMPRVDYPITQITRTSPTTKDLTMASTSGLVAGQAAYIALALPNWMGGCKIMSVRPTSVTVSHFRKDTRPENTAGESGGTMRLSRFPSQLVNSDPNNAGIAPVLSCPYGIQVMENMCLEGGGYIFNVTEGAMKNCQLIGAPSSTEGAARRCLNQYQGFFGLIGENVFGNCGWGIFSLGVLTAFDQTIINAATQGIQSLAAVVGSITSNMPNALVYLVHCYHGVYSNGGSFGGGSIFYCENDVGFYAQGLGLIELNSNYASYPQNNGTDLYAQGLSYIQYGLQGQPAPSCNPAAEVVGNQNSLIHLIP